MLTVSILMYRAEGCTVLRRAELRCAAWIRKTARFQFGAIMLDTPLGGLDTYTRVGPALGNH
eukprot:6181469-Pyramimonas_sp.AAC.1